MLTAQFAVFLEPVVIQILAAFDNLQLLQGDILVALGLVVGIDFLEPLIEQGGKLLEVGRFAGELDEPLMAALSLSVHKDRSGRVFEYFGPRLLTSILESLLRIVHNQFLAEGIDEMLRAARDDELIRILGRELHRVANLVAPESTRRRDEHGVILANLDALEGNDGGMIRGRTVGSDGINLAEFIEHIIVEHQQHGRIVGITLQTEETL